MELKTLLLEMAFQMASSMICGVLKHGDVLYPSKNLMVYMTCNGYLQQQGLQDFFGLQHLDDLEAEGTSPSQRRPVHPKVSARRLSKLLLHYKRKERLVGGWATPLKNMSSSIGMIGNPIYGKIKNVPNHQPGRYIAN